VAAIVNQLGVRIVGAAIFFLGGIIPRAVTGGRITAPNVPGRGSRIVVRKQRGELLFLKASAQHRNQGTLEIAKLLAGVQHQLAAGPAVQPAGSLLCRAVIRTTERVVSACRFTHGLAA